MASLKRLQLDLESMFVLAKWEFLDPQLFGISPGNQTGLAIFYTVMCSTHSKD